MVRLIVWRLVQLPCILIVIFLVTFLLAWVVPGNPLYSEGRQPPPEVEQAMKRQYGLDTRSGFMFKYVEQVAKGDLGPSLRRRGERVNDIIAAGLPVSATLGLAALIVALAIGLTAGVIGALWPGTPLDAGSLVLALLGVSLPAFVTGSVLLAVFAGVLHWAPIYGWHWPGWEFWTQDWWILFRRMLMQLILPALTLGAAPAAYIARLVRLGLADVMNSDFIRTARAKGLSRSQALFRHAMKVAFLPVLSFLGPAAAAAMTGSFVVEKVFAIPGIGRDFVDAVLNKDQFLILGVVLVYSTMLIAFNLLVDVAYAWVDPRIET
ncbi:MAG: ABC transporter permease [Phycisphaeraceae bacterium]